MSKRTDPSRTLDGLSEDYLDACRLGLRAKSRELAARLIAAMPSWRQNWTTKGLIRSGLRSLLRAWRFIGSGVSPLNKVDQALACSGGREIGCG